MRLTIDKFQQLYRVAHSKLDDIDKSIQYVKIMTGKSESEIERMKVEKFNRICNVALKLFNISMEEIHNTKPKNFIFVGHKVYKINYDVKKLTANRYVEISTFGNNVIENLHKIMATLVQEVKFTWRGLRLVPYDSAKHEEVSEIMLKANFRECYHTCVFFCQLFKHSIVALKHFTEGEEAEKMDQALTDFIKIMDGYTMPKWSQNLKISV